MTAKICLHPNTTLNCHTCAMEEELAAAIAQRDKAIEFLQVYRNDTPLGHQPHMIAHEVDQFLKECGK